MSVVSLNILVNNPFMTLPATPSLRALHRFAMLCLAASALGFGVNLAPTSASAVAGTASSGTDSPFIAQTQIATTVSVSFRPVGILQVDMGLLVSDQRQRARVKALQPVLRNAWRRTTQEFTNNYFVPGRVPDAVLLGQRLQAATDQAIGPNIGRVLFTSVVVR
jgi:hypothetical protein